MMPTQEAGFINSKIKRVSFSPFFALTLRWDNDTIVQIDNWRVNYAHYHFYTNKTTNPPT
jgi:hypothetical protein